MTTQTTDFQDLLQKWNHDPDLSGQLVHHRVLPAREACFQELDPPPPAELARKLEAKGVTRLYRHQVQAITKIRQREHVVIVAGTASGKSLCYQVPLAEALLEDPKNTALLLFPTKALAQDQARSLKSLEIPGMAAYNYDGDLPREDRPRVRRQANVIFTNPDMLHYGILPYHQNWERFLARLSLVVVDEMHYLRGIFGSHTAQILRRLRRVTDHYGSKPTFVFASATIGNPAELAQQLSGLNVQHLNGDDSPAGKRVVALWNPPLEEGPPGADPVRRSALVETTDLLVELVRRSIPTIAFTRSRKGAELVYRWSAGRLGFLKKRIASYRAGYTSADRRKIESRLFSGELLGITTTNALELGVDIGGLDAALISTFPGTLSSFRQQAGRAGRSLNMSLVTLIGGDDALDQYFMRNPQELFDRPPESAVINPDNPSILDAHVGCATYELPLTLADRSYLGDELEESVRRLEREGKLRQVGENLHWASGKSPAHQVSLRSAGDPVFTIFDQEESRPIGSMERRQAFRDAHEGATYLHQGQNYLVERLDLQRQEIGVRRAEVDYHTLPKVVDHLEVLGVDKKSTLGQMGLYLGRVRVNSQVTGYWCKYRKGRTSPFLALELPALRLETQAFWFTIPDELFGQAQVGRKELDGAIHAAEHNLIAMMPLFAICDRSDIGGVSIAMHPDTGASTIFIYDGHPGGAGIAPVAFKTAAELVKATRTSLERCPCTSGCPSCVQSPKCGNRNEPLSKQGSLRLLKEALSVKGQAPKT